MRSGSDPRRKGRGENYVVVKRTTVEVIQPREKSELCFHRLCDLVWGFPGGSVVKNLPAIARDVKKPRFNLWVGKIPWRKKWQPTPVFLPREFHGQRSLVGYSPLTRKELDTN